MVRSFLNREWVLLHPDIGGMGETEENVQENESCLLRKDWFQCGMQQAVMIQSSFARLPECSFLTLIIHCRNKDVKGCEKRKDTSGKRWQLLLNLH